MTVPMKTKFCILVKLESSTTQLIAFKTGGTFTTQLIGYHIVWKGCKTPLNLKCCNWEVLLVSGTFFSMKDVITFLFVFQLIIRGVVSTQQNARIAIDEVTIGYGVCAMPGKYCRVHVLVV